MHAVRATPRHAKAIHAVAELLGKLRVEAIFVGSVARSAWLGAEVASGSIDVLALMNAPQKNQVAMMAANRGFRVERSEIEQSEELDVVPLNFVIGEGDVRVHVLLASNALYGRMVAAGRAAQFEEREIRVAAAEDLALLLLVGEDDVSVRKLAALPDFDRGAFNDRLVSIGLAEQVIG
ncbi:MAG TPA: hypothetical protein VHL59_14335 [Thermoanaerobaculia bacterium]|nr:hypothetical protein [Thermoanaerobaculia bacterium]